MASPAQEANSIPSDPPSWNDWLQQKLSDVPAPVRDYASQLLVSNGFSPNNMQDLVDAIESGLMKSMPAVVVVRLRRLVGTGCSKDRQQYLEDLKRPLEPESQPTDLNASGMCSPRRGGDRRSQRSDDEKAAYLNAHSIFDAYVRCCWWRRRWRSRLPVWRCVSHNIDCSCVVCAASRHPVVTFRVGAL